MIREIRKYRQLYGHCPDISSLPLTVSYNDAEDDEDAEKVASALQSSLEEAHKAAFDGAPTKTWTSWSSGEVSLKETWGSTLPKLSTLKAKYDPENVLARGCSVAGPVSK